MSWGREWPTYQPRPRAWKPTAEALAGMRDKAAKFIERSPLLRELSFEVRAARGRLYFIRKDEDVARITPLSSRTLLLESPRRTAWSESARGSLQVVLNAIERDEYGSFHGLGSFASRRKTAREPTVQERLHREFGVPLDVVVEPRDWYEKRRMPKIVEADAERGRVLVRFEQFGAFGTFGGTGLYARFDGEWGFYEIPPKAKTSIATAETWLVKHMSPTPATEPPPPQAPRRRARR